MKRKHSPWILEAWATWQLLRRLGFSSDDIFWEFVPTANAIPRPGIALNIVLRAQDKTLVVTCSHRLSEGEARRMKRDVLTFQEKFIAGEFSDVEMTKILHASHAWTSQAGLVAALQSKGFVFPYTQS